MKYLLDDNGYYLGTVNLGSEGVEISEPLPSYTNIQRVKYNGSNWIVEDSEALRIQQEKFEATQYKRDRVFAYPDIGDQLDDLYKQGAFSDEMAAKIKKVKDDNPKPS
jgi:hypothetical protein